MKMVAITKPAGTFCVLINHRKAKDGPSLLYVALDRVQRCPHRRSGRVSGDQALLQCIVVSPLSPPLVEGTCKWADCYNVTQCPLFFTVFAACTGTVSLGTKENETRQDETTNHNERTKQKITDIMRLNLLCRPTHAKVLQ
jgi:hypothetical protein